MAVTTTTAILLLTLFMHSTTTITTADIHPDLHELRLSHFAFHSDRFKVSLANSIATTSPNAGIVVIVGVEWGNDMAALANAGHTIIAVESDESHVKLLRKRVRENPSWDVRVVHAFAGFTDMAPNQVTVDTLVGDDDIFVDVLSIDVQGAEWDVLQGSMQILRQGRVKSLWVESIACQASALHVLHRLQSEFELFDFVPWGLPHGLNAKVPMTLDSFVLEPDRSPQIDGYWQWLCDTQRQSYKWLQTDILAVRKDLVDEQFRRRLQALLHLCDSEARCVLREFEEQKMEL